MTPGNVFFLCFDLTEGLAHENQTAVHHRNTQLQEHVSVEVATHKCPNGTCGETMRILKRGFTLMRN